MRSFLWVSIAINFTTAGVNCWLIYRNAQVRKRVDAASETASNAIDQTMREVAPAIAFCVMMRELPGVPEGLRRIAAESIPKSVEVSTTVLSPSPDQIVH